MFHTTFRKLKEADACPGPYRKLVSVMGGEKYGRDTPIPLSVGFEHGFDFHDEILWCLPHCIEDTDKVARLFACDCAEHVLHIFEDKRPDDERPRRAIEVARTYSNGDATAEEWDSAWAVRAAGAAARDAAGAAEEAARDAAWAAWAAGAAAWAAGAAARDARAAARDAAGAAGAAGAAAGAAGAAELDWQIARFKEYLDTEEPET